MAVEIERKFLVRNDAWRNGVEDATRIMQGYLSEGRTATVRARIRGDRGFLTIKGAGQGLEGIRRLELEYEIPVEDAEVMLRQLAVSAVVEKTRYRVRCGRHLWDLDVFEGANAGLVVAEVELGAEDERFERPEWAGDEVSGDPRYFNAQLARHPYRDW